VGSRLAMYETAGCITMVVIAFALFALLRDCS
jgi:hypothetical protein